MIKQEFAGKIIVWDDDMINDWQVVFNVRTMEVISLQLGK